MPLGLQINISNFGATLSIYNRRGWDNVSDLRPRAAAPENTLSGDSSAGSQDWSKLRKAKPAEHLLPLSERFLEQLPSEVFPGALATHYARIVNVIASHWHDRGGCEIYFKELLTDQRAGRQGFPGPVRRDLVNLWGYWQRGGPQLKI